MMKHVILSAVLILSHSNSFADVVCANKISVLSEVFKPNAEAMAKGLRGSFPFKVQSNKSHYEGQGDKRKLVYQKGVLNVSQFKDVIQIENVYNTGKSDIRYQIDKESCKIKSMRFFSGGGSVLVSSSQCKHYAKEATRIEKEVEAVQETVTGGGAQGSKEQNAAVMREIESNYKKLAKKKELSADERAALQRVRDNCRKRSDLIAKVINLEPQDTGDANSSGDDSSGAIRGK
jgi:hypothetical protein